MKKDHMKCDPELLSRLLDGELEPDEHAMVSRHIEDCPSCQKVFRENEAISENFRAGLDETLSQINFTNFEQRVLERIQKKRVPWWRRLRDLFSSNRFLVPATAVAAMLVFFFFFTRHPTPLSGPSAIVDSFTGEISSVMILETPKSHQTIIWFNEPI